MNKTYKVIGAIWDKLDTLNEIKYMDNNEFINYLDEKHNIFDTYGIRKINISDLLKIEKEEELNIIIDKMKEYEAILINMDYIPVNNKIILDFYYKRISQIYNYLSSRLPNCIIYITS